MTLFGRIKNGLIARWAILREAVTFLWASLRYNASIRTEKDPAKLSYLILREAHTLEKGMSLRNPRKGFGVQKAEHLLWRLETYAGRYPYSPVLAPPLSILRQYLDFSPKDGPDFPALEARYQALLTRWGNPAFPLVPSLIHAPALGASSFEEVLTHRHSFRYFTRQPVDEELILKALTLSSHTPSACNRQAWRTHVFTGEKCLELLRWQGGCRGFEEEPQACILVTADRKAFLHYELFQPYVDGGLYAMNLILALQSLSLATIPLSCGFHSWKLKGLKAFDIPSNEVPVVIIGIGHPEEDTLVAASRRQAVEMTNTFHP